MKRILVFLMLLLVAIIYWLAYPLNNLENVVTTYECDVTLLTMGTEIDVYQGEVAKYHIEGDMVRVFSNNLRMTNTSGSQVGKTNAAYNIIQKNAHEIYINDRLMVTIVRDRRVLFSIFAGYTIFNNVGNQIGTIKFNMFNNFATMYDMSGNIMATYCTNVFSILNFEVEITRDAIMDDRTILLAFSSAYDEMKK